jgi:PAS domain S-box-containing protein
MPLSIWILVDGRIRYANPAAARLLGARTAREIEDREAIELIDLNCREAFSKAVGKVLSAPPGGSDTATVHAQTFPCACSRGPAVEAKLWRIGWDGISAVQVTLTPSADAVARQRSPQERELRMRARLLDEVVSDAVIRADLQGRIVGWNRGAGKLFGLTEPAALGHSIAKVCFPERSLKEVLTALAENGTFACAGETTRRDGEVSHVQAEFSLQRDEDGLVYGIVGRFVDVTKQQETQRSMEQAWIALQKRTEENELYYQLAPVGLAVVDADLRYVRINEVLAGLNGATVEAHLGRSVREMLPGFAPLLEPLLMQVIKTGEPVVDYELTGGRPFVPEETRTCLISMHRVQLAGNEAAFGAACTVVDATARKQTEKRLRHSEERLSLAQTAAHIGIWEWDLAGRQLTLSPEIRQLLPVQPDGASLSAKSMLQLVHPDDRMRVQAGIRDSIVSGGPVSLEFRTGSEEQGVRWFACKGRTVMDGENRTPRLIGVVWDITERKLEQQELWESRERLRLALKAGQMYAFDWHLPSGQIWRSEDSGPLLGPEAGDGDTFLAALEQEDRAIILDELDALTPQRDWCDLRFRITQPDGTVATFRKRARGMFDDRGQLTRLFGVAINITDQVAAAGALLASEEQARLQLAEIESIYASAPVGMCVLDRELRFVRVNQPMARITGLAVEEHKRRPIHEVAPELARTIEPDLRQVLDTGVAVSNGEVCLPATDNATAADRICLFSCDPLRDATGRVTAVNVVLHDITKEKQAQQRLHENAALLQAVSEGTTELIAVKDLEGRFLMVNEAAGDMYGANPEEMLGRTEAELLGAFGNGMPVNGLSPNELWVVDSASPGTFQEVLTVRGIKHHLLSTKSPYFDQEGALIGVISLSTDVTERKQIEEALQLYRNRFDMVIESVNLGVWFRDLPNGKLVWNARCREQSGMGPHEEPTLEGFFQRIHSHDRERVRTAIAEAIASGRLYDVEFRTVAPDGRVRWLRSLGRCSYQRGEPARFDGISFEISEQKRTEEQLRSAIEDLNQFAYAVAHDLREPLRNVANYSELLVQRFGEAVGPQSERYSAVVVEGVTRLQILLDDLLRYATLAARAEAPPELIDLNGALKSAIANLATHIRESGTQIRCDRLPVVMGHHSAYVALFQNLLSNAIKYRSAETPQVDISVGSKEGEWLFSVSDNGIGISPRYQQVVFGLFKRLHGREIQGTGIGLAICAKVVERAGGRIWIEPQAQPGSLFQFTLPMRLEEKG